MIKIVGGLILIIMLIPISSVSAQNIDKPQTLAVKLTSDSPLVYRDSDGFLVVIGEVTSSENSPISNIRIRVNFYEQLSSQPSEVVRGGTVLEVIPPLGTSPYLIKSQTANPKLTQITVSVEGFDSSPPKTNGLQIIPSDTGLDSSFRFSGTIKNIGGADSGNVKVYVTFYDVFDPPRLVGLSSTTLTNIPTNGEAQFKFDESPNERAVSFSVFSESQVFQSNTVKMVMPQSNLITRLVTLDNVSLLDESGSSVPQAHVGIPVSIQTEAWIQYSSDQKSSEHPYLFYAQVVQSGTKPFVEYIGMTEGKFIDVEKQFPQVKWTPEHEGVYYVETFLWDDVGVPMAEPGPILLVVVSK